MAHERRHACPSVVVKENSGLLVRKVPLDTVERWLRMLGPGRHVTVRLRTTDPAVYAQLRITISHFIILGFTLNMIIFNIFTLFNILSAMDVIISWYL